ncbi:MAG: hypothetical protein ACE5FP_11340 [Gemmatimonadota bacterium]
MIRLHLYRCRNCRTYAEQLRAIGQAARSILYRPGLDSEKLDQLEADILRKLADGPGADRPPEPG